APAPGLTATPAASAVAGNFTSVTFRFGYRYTVQPGDNLFRIALRYRTTVVAIRAANKLGANLIYVGQELVVPTNFALSAPPASAPATSPARTATPAAPATRPPT